MNGPWLDMSAYPNLPPDDAVEVRVLDTLRAVLRAPEVTPLRPDAWSHAVDEAVTGEPARHDHDPAADGGFGPEARHEGLRYEGEHETGGWESGWPGGHDAAQDGLSDLGDRSGQHDPGDGGGHW